MTDTIDTRQRRDFEDQQNELAGRETGRMARFGVGAAREQELQEKKRSARAFRDALDRLLLDPEYRRFYEDLGNALGTAELSADRATDNIRDELRHVDDQIASMEQDAGRDLEGRAVFRFANGRVVYADGCEVPPEIAEGIIWPEGAPSAEEYFATKDRQSALQSALEEWLIYRNEVLGGIRDRYDDRENPMSKDEMWDALEEIERARPSLTLLDAPASADVTSEPTPASELTLPASLR